MSAPPTIERSAAEHLSGGDRLRAGIDRLRAAAAENSVVKITPDAAMAIADLIDVLARQAGIELPESKS